MVPGSDTILVSPASIVTWSSVIQSPAPTLSLDPTLLLPNSVSAVRGMAIAVTP